MKADYFDLRFWQNHLLMFLASILLIIFFSFQIAAQPGDCISMNWQGCAQQRDELLQKYASEIKVLDEKILRDPQNAELFYQRGKIYSAMMFEKNLGFKTVEFDGRVYFTEIDAKAVADYTQAIRLSPKAEYYEERGNIYRVYWEKETPSLSIGEKKAKEETLKLIEQLFLKSENFKAAERDFQRAVESGEDYEPFNKSRWKLVNLHRVRAFSLGSYEDIAVIIGDKKAADVALADQDYVIDFHRNLYAHSKKSWDKTLIYDALINKGRMARNFGRDALAFEVFNEAEKYWNETEGNCFVFTYRASIFLKRAEIEPALRQLTSAIESGNPSCREATQFRGDIYFRKGEWQSAIQDYTTYLNSGYGKFSELFLKRGTAYLKIGEAEKAVADFDHLIEEQFIKSCPQYFLLRAEGYKLAGKTDLAATDEKTASELPKNLKQPGCQINLLN